MITLKPGEEIIRETKPHAASFLGSPYFWAGILIFLIGVFRGFRVNNNFISFILIVIGFLLIGFSYIRRVAGYKFYLTNQRIISNYRFVRKLDREVSYDEIIDIVVEKGLFAKMFGYADIWLFGYRKEWIVGRMRGVCFGDCVIITNKAWKTKLKG
jgi:hypothetical protein